MSIRSLWAALLVAAVGVGWFSCTRPQPTRLTFLSVGQGDCAVFQHGGRTVLVDAGPALAGFDGGARIVVPRLRAMGIDRVDLLLLTHPDLDHTGGAAAVLAAYPGARVAMSAAFRTDKEMEAHLRGWRVSASDVVWLPTETRLAVGDFAIRLYAPPHSAGEDANAGSEFARISGQGASAVLTGDAPAEAEMRALGLGDWSAQVLKAGHHGSRTASSPAWLRGVHPEWFVISCGRDNRYGHPSREVLDRAASAHLKVARTDREGDIVFEVRDGRFERIR